MEAGIRRTCGGGLASSLLRLDGSFLCRVLERLVERPFFREHVVEARTMTTRGRWSVGGGGGIPRPFRPLPPPLTARPNPCRSNLLPPSRPLAPPSSPRCPRPSPYATPHRTASRRAALYRATPRHAAPFRTAPSSRSLPPARPLSRPRRTAMASRVTLIPRDPFDRHPRGTARRGCEVADNAEIPPRRGSWLSASQPRALRALLLLARERSSERAVIYNSHYVTRTYVPTVDACTRRY